MALPYSLRRFWSALDTDLRVFLLGYLVLLPFFWAPLVFTKYLPGLDLGFHLSTADLLSKGVGPDSPYHGFYSIKNLWAPYSAHYLALVAIGKLVGGIALAHNVVVCLYVAALPTTLAAFLSACGKSRIPALLAFPLAYNLCLHYGFISFCLSLPALFALFATLCHLLRRPTFSWTSWSAAAASGVLLFFCHLQNLLFGLCGAAVLLTFTRAPWRRRALALASLGPTLASLLYWHLQTSFKGDPNEQKKTLAFAWQAVKAARVVDFLGGKRPLSLDLRERLEHVPEMALKGFTDLSDVAGAKALLFALAAYVVMGLLALLLPRGARPRPRFGLATVFLALGALFAFLALPHHLWAFELMTFFPRFSVLLLLLLIPLVPAGLRRLPWHSALLALAPALILGVLYGKLVNTKYHAYREEIRDFITVLNKVPRDGKLMGIIFDRKSSVMRIESALVSLPAFYVAVHPDARTMVPVHYCGMRHMPCAVEKTVPWPGPWMGNAFNWDETHALFDYYLVQHATPSAGLLGPLVSRVQPMAGAGKWALFRKGQ